MKTLFQTLLKVLRISKSRWRIAVSLVGSIALTLAGIIAFPAPLFAYSYSYSLQVGQLEILSDQPIPESAGLSLLKKVERQLAQSPFSLNDGSYQIIVANTAWRGRLFFLLAPKAGGVVYYPLSRKHVFLSGADFAKELLVKSGKTLQAPRTLAFYATHELVHTLMGERLGTLAFHRLPAWIREGLADYIALEKRQSFEVLYAAIGGQEVNLSMMRQFGAYPTYRLLVTFFLEQHGWSVEKLLASDLSYEQATALMQDSVE